MDKSRRRPSTPAEPVRRRRRIGFIGKATLTPQEAGMLWYIGRCIAVLGHEVVLTEAPGAATALRKGVEVQGGTVIAVDGNTIDEADHTHIYADDRLLERLEAKYKNLHSRPDVLIIPRARLDEWYDAVRQVVIERGLTPPQ